MQKPLGYKIPTFSEGMVTANMAGEDAVEVLKTFIKDDPRWTYALGYAMNPGMKCILPEGAPPYNESEFPEGISDSSVLGVAKEMGMFYNPNGKRMKLEEMFIRHLEGMTPDDAKHFIAIKDKTLHKMYPNVTEEVLVAALGWDWGQYQAKKNA